MCKRRNGERGFVLVTSLVILMILTIMLLGLYFRSQVNTESSFSERDTTQAFYLAEAGLNYITWALYMDPSNAAADNNVSLDGDTSPDNVELQVTPDQLTSHTLGYFDITNKMNYNPAAPSSINFSALSSLMPAHVALNITTNAANNVSVTVMPWGSGNAIPAKQGAVVWLVPTVLDDNVPANEKDITDTSADYAIYAYSIGYVNGKPIKMLRAKIGTMSSGFPANLGSMTNGYQ